MIKKIKEKMLQKWIKSDRKKWVKKPSENERKSG